MTLRRRVRQLGPKVRSARGVKVRRDLQCSEIALAVLGNPVNRKGLEVIHRCPNHDDQHPSLKINPSKNLWMCGPCGAGGNAWQLAAFISKLDPNDNDGVNSWLTKYGLSSGKESQPHAPITVDDLARDKCLPTKFLESLGLRNVADGVLIPYHQIDGSEAPRHRVRTALIAKNGSHWGGLRGDDIVPYGLERCLEGRKAGLLVFVEGESDQWTLTYHGFPAVGIPGSMMAKALRIEHVASIKTIYIFREPDKAGSDFVAGVSERLWHLGWQGQTLVVTLDGVKDPNELHKACPAEFKQKLQTALDGARPLKGEKPTGFAGGVRINPWSLAVGMEAFLGVDEVPPEFMFPRVIVKGTVVEVFSPRGLGKSLWALYVAVLLAKAGKKVLLIDRDNPRRIVRERLRAFGATADLAGLKILSRDNAPPLSNARAWAEFPYHEYDLVIVDSLDSASEGIGEQDSTKPSLAIAPLLDIARHEDGPAVLLLGNTIKSAKHSRGSGVIEDRADIVFEVRDATSLNPTGKKPWIEELPAADAGSWTGRSIRRKRLSKYRLAFISSKFRIGEEPEPFIIEIDLTTEPWTVRDVTDEVDREGVVARTRVAEERAATVRTATESLKAEVFRRNASGEPVLLKKQAEDFLVSRDNTRSLAREVIESPAFETVPVAGKGHPKGVRVAGKNHTDGGNSSRTKDAPDEGFGDGDFGRPHPQHTAEIAPPQESENTGAIDRPVSAAVPIYSESFDLKSDDNKQISDLDFDDELTI